MEVNSHLDDVFVQKINDHRIKRNDKSYGMTGDTFTTVFDGTSNN